MSKKTEQNCRLGAVGGQAVLEGIMMRHKDRCSIAVRKEDGTITVKNDNFVPLRKKYKICNVPIIRGAINMVEMLMLSLRTMSDSAEMLGLEDELESDKKKKQKAEASASDADGKTEKKKGIGVLDIVMALGMILGVALSLFLFMFLPSFFTGLIEKLVKADLGAWKAVIEGVIKLAIFVGYLASCTLMKDIRTTFEYHGAEHKSIFCYEAGEELTPENVKKYTRFHPRCGTSFMFFMILVGIVVGTLIPWNGAVYRTLIKIAILPIVVGISFEFIMIAGKHSENFLVKLLSAPGLFVQRITTREPSLEQIEVAIHALKSAMPEEFPDYVAPEIFADNTIEDVTND